VPRGAAVGVHRPRAFKSGVLLIRLVETLFNDKIDPRRYRANPARDLDMVLNCDCALDSVKAKGVRVVAAHRCPPREESSGNLKRCSTISTDTVQSLPGLTMSRSCLFLPFQHHLITDNAQSHRKRAARFQPLRNHSVQSSGMRSWTETEGRESSRDSKSEMASGELSQAVPREHQFARVNPFY
jgi:hypothetical protein